MSHFAVMVLGQNVEQQLAPYHEFECTGTVNEYVQSIDKLEEARADYEECTRNMLRGPEGELVSPYDDLFYRDPTEEEAEKIGSAGGFGRSNDICYSSKDWGDGKGHRAKVQYVPDGWEKVEVPVKEFKSLLQYILDDHVGDFPVLKEGDEPDLHDACKWGWARVNADGEVIEYIDRTNPNKKWDWWVVGGRWSNSLKLKDTREGLKVVRDENQPAGHQVGIEVGPVSRDGELYVDQALKRDIDMEGMRNEAGIEAAAKWDKAAEAKIAAGFAADTTWDAWSVVVERHPNNVQAARDEYHAQGAMKAVQEALDLWRGADEFLTPREEFIQQARDSAMVYYALVKAAMLFQAKQDVRYYLNGIYITNDHIVATDGHTMFVAPYDSDLRPEQPMILAIKGKMSAKAYNLELLYDEESKIGVVRCIGPTPSSTMVRSGTSWVSVEPEPTAVLDKTGQPERLFFDMLEGRYPDWRRVLPKGEVEPTSQIGLDFNYCDRVAKASKELGSHFAQCVMNLYGPNTVVEVEIKSPNYPGAKAYIMPCRL